MTTKHTLCTVHLETPANHDPILMRTVTPLPRHIVTTPDLDLRDPLPLCNETSPPITPVFDTLCEDYERSIQACYDLFTTLLVDTVEGATIQLDAYLNVVEWWLDTFTTSALPARKDLIEIVDETATYRHVDNCYGEYYHDIQLRTPSWLVMVGEPEVTRYDP